MSKETDTPAIEAEDRLLTEEELSHFKVDLPINATLINPTTLLEAQDAKTASIYQQKIAELEAKLAEKYLDVSGVTERDCRERIRLAVKQERERTRNLIGVINRVYIRLDDMNATGGYSFIMTEIIDALNKYWQSLKDEEE